MWRRAEEEGEFLVRPRVDMGERSVDSEHSEILRRVRAKILLHIVGVYSEDFKVHRTAMYVLRIFRAEDCAVVFRGAIGRR